MNPHRWHSGAHHLSDLRDWDLFRVAKDNRESLIRRETPKCLQKLSLVLSFAGRRTHRLSILCTPLTAFLPEFLASLPHSRSEYPRNRGRDGLGSF
jgi:hypothetical protein